MYPYVTEWDNKVEAALIQSVEGVLCSNVLVLVLGQGSCQESLQCQGVVVPMLQYPPGRVDLWEKPFNRPIEFAEPFLFTIMFGRIVDDSVSEK